MDPESKIKDHMIEEFAQYEKRPPWVSCDIYLTIWHEGVRDTLKENVDFPCFNCWILRWLLLEKSHLLQAQHAIVKYQLTHLVSNDSNDMIIVKVMRPSRTGFASNGCGLKLQSACPSSVQSWKRRATTASFKTMVIWPSAYHWTHLIPNFRFSVPHRGGTTVPFETYYINLLFGFAIFVSGVYLIFQSCCVCQNSYYPRQCPMYMGVLSSNLKIRLYVTVFK